MFIPRGTSFDDYSQEDISLMMDHFNSYARPSLGNKTPYEMMEFLYGSKILDLLGCHRIAPDDIVLDKSVLKKGESTDA